MDLFNKLEQEFEKESDRAAVILAASFLDDLLRSALIGRLTSNHSTKDSLFDGANAPLSSFSSRIDMAFRLGIISDKFARDLHIIRRLRNDFAHNVTGCTFDNPPVKSRVEELMRSHGILERTRNYTNTKETMSVRFRFLMSASWMTAHLEGLCSKVQSLTPQNPEWGYTAALDDYSS
jgi:DNA-binding MltR family transcriptional regulator